MSSYYQNENSVDYGQYGGYDQECPSDDEGDESAALFAGSMAPDDDKEQPQEEDSHTCEEGGTPEKA